MLDRFGTFSGYKLNLQKSECFPINNLALQIPQEALPFHFSPNGFKYLGINMTRSFSSLFEANYKVQLKEMKADIERWHTLPLTLAGRIQSVKMTILPKFLYLFQSLPVFLPKSFFHLISQSISSFIWENKIPRVNKNILQRTRDVGGLGLPSFIHYYWASNIQKILFWLHLPETNWCLIESQTCFSSLPALVYSSLPLKTSQFTSNPVILSTLKIFNQFRCHYKFTSASVLGPIYKNHLFPPSMLDSLFRQWSSSGLERFKDLYVDDSFNSFENLCIKYNLPHNHFFRYLQVRSFAMEKFPQFPALPPVHPLDNLTLNFINKGLISILYSKLMCLKEYNVDKIKSRWEDELGVKLSETFWEEALRNVHASSSSVRLGLIQFKVLHRVHLSKARLAGMYPGIEASCDRCSFSPADLTHMLWSCPSLNNYWTLIFKSISEALGVALLPCSSIGIFGTPSDTTTITLSATQKGIIAYTSLLARRRILLCWKSSTPPSVTAWFEDVMSFLKLEKIKYTLRGSVDRFYTYWEPILSYFTNLKELPCS